MNRFEWHPFTISSPPEQDDTFSVHIRSAGGWTNALHQYVANLNTKWANVVKNIVSNNKEGPEVAWTEKNPHFEIPKAEPMVVYIDGPHSAPSSTIFSSEHAVLVATGIGVTPFASILQSIVAR